MGTCSMKLVAALALAGLAIAAQPSFATGSSSGPKEYIAVIAAAQLEVAADQLNINIRVKEQADSMAAVMDKLKQKRQEITDVSNAAGFAVTGLEMKQVDVNSSKSGEATIYHGKANFQLGITGYSDALDAVSDLGSIEAESIGQIQFVLSPQTNERIKAELRQMTETNARENGKREAITRGKKLGDMIDFDYRQNQHNLGSGQTSFTLTGRGEATFIVE
jgi:uncharacterized protein YggE